METIAKLDMGLKEDADARNLWKKFCDVNSETAYERQIIKFAECWGKMIDSELKRTFFDDESSPSRNFDNFAEKTSLQAKKQYSVDTVQWNEALSILCRICTFGESLRKWQNKKMGYPNANGLVLSTD